MTDTTIPAFRGRRPIWRRRSSWLAAALLFWVGCGTLVPRQGWDKSLGPVVPHDTFPSDCALCHTGNDWSTIRGDFAFDHAKQTGVALHGAHAQVACLMCHNDRGPVGGFAAQGCGGCHQDPHRGDLGRRCDDCHGENTWAPEGQIATHNRTRFPLVGAHAAVACFRCHPGATTGNFAGASTECADCHQDDLARATDPDHQANGWTTGCQRCHRAESWKPAQVEHPASFPLTFGHSGRRCSDCHQPGTYAGLSTACASCHLDDYNSTTLPPHASSGFGTDCRGCHNTVSWAGAGFTHPATFPLTNAHAVACNRCHTTPGTFTGLSTDCYSCHRGDYQAAVNPTHAGIGMPTTCRDCHGTIAWRPSTFRHLFPLSGHHALNCTECHRDPTNVRNFSCTHCHGQSETASHHSGVSGYSWVSSECYRCHPRG